MEVPANNVKGIRHLPTKCGKLRGLKGGEN